MDINTAFNERFPVAATGCVLELVFKKKVTFQHTAGTTAITDTTFRSWTHHMHVKKS